MCYATTRNDKSAVTPWKFAYKHENEKKFLRLKTISQETLRQILKDKKVSLQRTKTWKESNDPDFEVVPE